MKQLELEVPRTTRRVVVYNDPPGSDGEYVKLAEINVLAAPQPYAIVDGKCFVNGVWIALTEWEPLWQPPMSGWWQVNLFPLTRPEQITSLWWDSETQCFYQDASPAANIIVPPSVSRPWRGLQECAPGFFPLACPRSEPTAKPSTRRVILEN